MISSFPCTLGDYTLLSLIGEKGGRLYFDAIQISTSRKVILEMPDPESSNEEAIQRFLDEVRVKASAESPLFTTVYEASQTNGTWCFSYEKPDGINMALAIEQGKTFSAAQLLELLKTACKAEEFFTARGLTTAPITPELFFEETNGSYRMINPVMPGSRSQDASTRDMVAIGTFLPSLITPGIPGATRMGTIAAWMRDGQDGKRLTWQHVAEMVETVESQLGIGQNATTGLVVHTSGSPIARYKGAIIAGVAALLIGVLAILLHPDSDAGETVDTQPQLQHPVFDKRDHTGIPIHLGKDKAVLVCDAYEVTIGAYKNFLDSLNNMPPQGRKSYDHPEQPAEKANHIPLDWDAILDAAQQGKVWEGYTMSMRTPVFNVDFWDAYAYATWKGHRLPTGEEWKTIASQITSNGNDPMGPVDSYLKDVGEKNLCGFNSGVSEWTSSKEKNPAMPMEGEKPIACGGNSISPGKQKINYLPTPDTREKTIGFRTVRDQ